MTLTREDILVHSVYGQRMIPIPKEIVIINTRDYNTTYVETLKVADELQDIKEIGSCYCFDGGKCSVCRMIVKINELEKTLRGEK